MRTPVHTTPETGSPLTKGELTRRSVLDAAIERFGRDGYRSTSVAEIARDAGVGSTVAYTYFPNKEALFLAAVDEDAAAAIHESIGAVFLRAEVKDWRLSLVMHMVEAIDHHPLARRLLAGLEPDVTGRVLETPALGELRRLCAGRLREEQTAGTVRHDIDPELVGNGMVAILLSLLMSVVQLGTDSTLVYADHVVAVFDAALDPIITDP
ncbi:MAG: TetR/AcrR family transcriptional regulator [Aquihabitans sp.]